MRPFIGPAGQLFNRLTRNVGIFRTECYITNVIKERPPNNDISKFIDLSRGIPKCTPQANSNIEVLKDELSKTTSNVIVALGNVPLWVLTGKIGITKYRGSVLPCTLVPGRKVLACIHPSAALRQYMYQYYISMDLRKALRESKSPTLAASKFDYLIRPTFIQTIESLEQLLQHSIVAFDIEVLGNEVSCLSFAAENFAISIPFIHYENNLMCDYFTPTQELEVWEAITRILEHPNITKILQNATFDCTFVYQRYGIHIHPTEDTMIAQGILYPDFPKSLDFLTAQYTNEPYYKDDGKRWFKIGGKFDDLWLYNAKDSAVTLDIFQPQYAKLSKSGNLPTYQHQRNLIDPLVYLGSKGIRCNIQQIKKDSIKIDNELQDLNERLQAIKPGLNPRSPKQVKDYFYGPKSEGGLGLKPYINRKSGNASTDVDALKRLSRKGIEAATILLRLRKLDKLKTSYYDIQIDADGRLRSSYNPVGTISGRLSSSKNIFGTGANLQNMPDKFKKYLLFDEGYIGYQIDLSQAENRCVAYIAPEPKMIQAFESGLDLHRNTAALIFNKPYDQISKEPGSSPFAVDKSERDVGKQSNHSLNYDLGYKSFALKYEMQESDAKRIVEAYHSVYPGVRQYHAWIRALLAKGRSVQNCYGRTYTFMERWGDKLFKDAYAFVPQSTVADHLNRFGFCFVYYHTSQLFKPVELINQVHDSIVFQIPVDIPLDQHTEILRTIVASLETPIPIPWRGTSFRIPADVEVAPPGGNLGKFHPERNPGGLRPLTEGTDLHDIL